jgi:hypothetical protein
MEMNVSTGTARVARRAARVLLGLLTAVLIGCGGGSEFDTAPVHGKVTYQGKPVEGGSITLRPLATGDQSETGKPASGEVQADGSYALSTYGDQDGAVVGRHQVLYTPPYIEPDRALKPGESAPASPWDGLVPKQQEIEIKAGDNAINIELAPAG